MRVGVGHDREDTVGVAIRVQVDDGKSGVVIESRGKMEGHSAEFRRGSSGRNNRRFEVSC